MSQAQGKLGENWTTCVTGPASIQFWRLVNTSTTAVTVGVAVRDANGDFRPLGQGSLVAMPAGGYNGGALDVIDSGQKLGLAAGEQAVARCSNDQAVSFRITE